MAFPSKVKAGSMSTRATMYPNGHATRHETRHGVMSGDQGPVPEGESGNAMRGLAGETPDARGAEGHGE